MAQKVDVVMRKYVSDNGYTLLLNVGDQQSPVMWAATEPNADITVAVIEAYNAASKVAPPPPAAPAAAARPKPASTTTPRTTTAAKPAAEITRRTRTQSKGGPSGLLFVLLHEEFRNSSDCGFLWKNCGFRAREIHKSGQYDCGERRCVYCLRVSSRMFSCV